MIIDEWKYENKLVRCVDDDKFYCNLLNRWVDLGWDYVDSTVHNWISSLNVISAKIFHQTGKSPREIRINKNTFDLIELENNYYFKNGKLNHYVISIIDNIKDNEIQLFVSDKIQGKINIVK